MKLDEIEMDTWLDLSRMQREKVYIPAPEAPKTAPWPVKSILQGVLFLSVVAGTTFVALHFAIPAIQHV